MRHASWAIRLFLLLQPACLGGVGQPGSPPAASAADPLVPPADTLAPGYRTADVVLTWPPPAPPTPPTPPPPVQRLRLPTQPAFGAVGAGTRRALPISGGTLLVLRGGRIAVASDPERDRIFVADLDEGRLIREIALEPGSEPGRLAQDASGRVFALLRSAGQLVTLAAGSYELAERRPVCAAPRGLAALPDGSRVYVACAGGELVALPGEGKEPLFVRTLERDLRDVLLEADGSSLLVTTFRSARALRVDLDGGLRGEMKPAASLNLTRRSRSGTEGPAATRFQPAVAWRTLPLPRGGAVMLHQRGFTGQIPIDPTNVGASGGYGGPNCGGSIVESVVSLLSPADKRLPSPALGGMVLAVDAALSTDGETIAIVAAGDSHAPALGSTVQIGPLVKMTAANDSGCVGGPSSAFGAPSPQLTPGTQVATQFPTQTPDVSLMRLSGEAVAVAFDDQRYVVVQLREPARLYLARGDRWITLSGESVASLGQAVFHASSGAGIACASCHPEGGDDGQVWRFLELGPRRTQSLRGGISETVPLHWDGDMRDLAQISREVFTNRMGGPELTAPETEALAGWIDGIPFVPRSPPADPAAVERGQAIFHSAQTGCAACHNGPRLTNNLTVDVGTGRPLQVPSLLGLGARAPYLHTGCADTLAARFDADCGGGDRHGVTGTLSSAQADDLRAYLESL
jgi:mono/diheme cytochrome c family protein